MRLTGSEGSGEAWAGEVGRIGESGESTCTSFSGCVSCKTRKGEEEPGAVAWAVPQL